MKKRCRNEKVDEIEEILKMLWKALNGRQVRIIETMLKQVNGKCSLWNGSYGGFDFC